MIKKNHKIAYAVIDFIDDHTIAFMFLLVIAFITFACLSIAICDMIFGKPSEIFNMFTLG